MLSVERPICRREDDVVKQLVLLLQEGGERLRPDDLERSSSLEVMVSNSCSHLDPCDPRKPHDGSDSLMSQSSAQVTRTTHMMVRLMTKCQRQQRSNRNEEAFRTRSQNTSLDLNGFTFTFKKSQTQLSQLKPNQVHAKMNRRSMCVCVCL